MDPSVLAQMRREEPVVLEAIHRLLTLMPPGTATGDAAQVVAQFAIAEWDHRKQAEWALTNLVRVITPEAGKGEPHYWLARNDTETVKYIVELMGLPTEAPGSLTVRRPTQGG